jgi:hypothetical protein
MEWHECEVGLRTIDCKNIENEGRSSLRKCYRCGKNACTGCSELRVSHTANGNRRIRMCMDCIEDERHDQPPL